MLARAELEGCGRGDRLGVVDCDGLLQKAMKSGKMQKILTARCNRLEP
jgi:hypothetical protein